jgi:hypothetical protein
MASLQSSRQRALARINRLSSARVSIARAASFPVSFDRQGRSMAAMDLVGLLLILFLVAPLVTARPSRY